MLYGFVDCSSDLLLIVWVLIGNSIDDLKGLIEVLDFMHAGWHLLSWQNLLAKLFLKCQVIILLLMEWRLHLIILSLTSIVLLLINILLLIVSKLGEIFRLEI